MLEHTLTKQAVVDLINSELKNERKENALDYIDFLFMNEISAIHKTGSTWGFDYLGENLSVIDISGHRGPGGWVIYWGATEPSIPQNYVIDEHLKEFAFAHIGFCGKCESNKPNYCGKRWTIYGKEFDDVCHAPLVFNEPVADELVKIKKLIEMRIQVINEMNKHPSPHNF